VCINVSCSKLLQEQCRVLLGVEGGGGEGVCGGGGRLGVGFGGVR
jgi:hypothetical protein